MDADPAAAVSLTGVHHAYGKVIALRGLDLSIPSGSKLALVGPDGVGKSTLLGLIADDADTVDVLRDDLDGGLRLPLADGGDLQGLLLYGGIPLRLNVARTLDPAEADEADAERRQGQQPVRPRNHAHDASPMHCRYSASRRVASPPHSRALVGSAQSLPWKKRQRSSSAQAPA